MENLEALRAKYPPQKYETQVEFERVMLEMNNEQEKINLSLLKKSNDVLSQADQVMIKLNELKAQHRSLTIERRKIELEQKEVKQLFHDIKHELLKVNPRENFARKDEEVA